MQMQPIQQLIFPLLLVAVHGQDYPNTMVLLGHPNDPDLNVRWNANATDVAIELTGKTLGWMSIGGSPNGQMDKSDILFTWIDDSGMVYAQDRQIMSDENAMTVNLTLDSRQNWFLLGGWKNETHTMVKARRKLVSPDPADYRFNETFNLIYAIGEKPPNRNSGETIMHTGRGSRLFSGFQIQTNGSLNESPGPEPGYPTPATTRTFTPSPASPLRNSAPVTLILRPSTVPTAEPRTATINTTSTATTTMPRTTSSSASRVLTTVESPTLGAIGRSNSLATALNILSNVSKPSSGLTGPQILAIAQADSRQNNGQRALSTTTAVGSDSEPTQINSQLETLPTSAFDDAAHVSAAMRMAESFPSIRQSGGQQSELGIMSDVENPPIRNTPTRSRMTTSFRMRPAVTLRPNSPTKSAEDSARRSSTTDPFGSRVPEAADDRPAEFLTTQPTAGQDQSTMEQVSKKDEEAPGLNLLSLTAKGNNMSASFFGIPFSFVLPNAEQTQQTNSTQTSELDRSSSSNSNNTQLTSQVINALETVWSFLGQLVESSRPKQNQNQPLS